MRLRTKPYDKRDDFHFPIVNFPFICSSFRGASAYGVYISQLIRYSSACGSYQYFLNRVLLLTRKLLDQGFLSWLSWKYNFASFTVTTMTWLTAMEYMCHKWQRICSTCRKHFRSFPDLWLITGFVTRLTWRVPLVEQELFILPEHLSSPRF